MLLYCITNDFLVIRFILNRMQLLHFFLFQLNWWTGLPRLRKSARTRPATSSIRLAVEKKYKLHQTAATNLFLCPMKTGSSICLNSAFQPHYIYQPTISSLLFFRWIDTSGFPITTSCLNLLQNFPVPICIRDLLRYLWLLFNFNIKQITFNNVY